MPEGDASVFSVITAVIRHGDKRAFKKATGIGKIDTVLNNIGESLFFIPFKFHCVSVFTFRKDVNVEIYEKVGRRS